MTPVAGIASALVAFATLAAGAGAGALPPEAAGVEAGLAVHVGATDGQLEIALARGGRRLVHGLARSDAARDAARAALQAKGLYGLATVETWHDTERLPFGDNAVNLLIAEVPSPDDKELLRVLAPKGVLLVRRDGAWTRTVKPRPAEMDDWGHFDHGADGNGVSHDHLVRQPHHMQWISGVKPIELGGNPAGYFPGAGVRVADGRLCMDYNLTDGKRQTESLLGGFDAFSGVPLWKRPRDRAAAHRRWQLVMDAARVYTFVEKDGPLVALDARTGETTVRYAAAEGKPLPEEGTQVRVADGLVLVNLDTGLFALEADTGKLRWKLPAEGVALLFPSVDAANRRVFTVVAEPASKLRSRWPWAVAKAVLCLDLVNGREIWRNEEVAGKPIGQLVAAGDYVAVFCGSAIGGRGEGGWVGSIRVSDGKLMGEGTFKVAWNDSMYNALVRDGTIYYAGHTTIYQAPLDTVQVTKAASLSYNQRCNRFAATPDLFIAGYVTYWDKAFNGTLQSVVRSGCAIGATPANGRVYFTPSACRCFTQLRGYTCLTPEPLLEAWPEPRRVQKGDSTPTPSAPPATTQLPGGPIADEWLRWGERATAAETEPVDASDGLRIVSVIHQHRVEAREADGRVRWSFTAGGRVSGKPLVVGDRVVFGCHDGRVYALRARDGALLWRSLVAPRERLMVAYGQIESTWPVYGVAMHQGRVVASAGRHPEISGGVHVAALDPATGGAVWRRRLAKPVARIVTANGRTTGNIVPRSFLNAPPVVEGDAVKIGEFAFTPDESDEAIQQRLNTAPSKKK
ncbi:MAG TPA: PQQ-binding-like beta-propeller repeat protein [Planctomycetota bacterium]|nr:PQQ-binding-like beta-propeller repeat protein [Planctomycetota bacterium]